MQVHTPAPTPSRAIYGLALYLGCRACFGFYIIWALLPDPWLKIIGFDFLPSKYWAIALPVLACVILAATAFLIYPGLGLILTPNPDEIESFTNNVAGLRHGFENRSFPSQYFVPTSEVCKKLYYKDKSL